MIATALSLAATFANPYGARLHAHVIALSQNPNLRDLTEWSPLPLGSPHGLTFLVVVGLLCLLLPFGSRRPPAMQIIWLIVIGVATIFNSRMLLWWSPVAAYCLVCRLQPLTRVAGKWMPAAIERTSVWWTVVAGTAIAIAGISAFPREREDLASYVSSHTPVAAARFLAAENAAGQLFNTYEWGDFLAWHARRRETGVRVFVGSHAHLVPRPLWQDYMSIAAARPGWQARLQRYDARFVVVDHRYRTPLIDRLKRSRDWHLVFEDRVAAVFRRTERAE